MRVVSTDPDFELRSAALSDRLPLSRMLELYQHDLSDVWDQDLDVHGEYGYSLDEYWQGTGAHAYVILVQSRYAGFALVVPRPKLPGGQHWLEQYFVVKKYRNRGVGQAAAVALFDSTPGVWQVGQMRSNVAAQAFWRRVINAYTNDSLSEAEVTNETGTSLVQQFSSRAASDA